MSNQTWAEYVRHVIAGRNQSQVAYVSGVNQTAIGRWLRGENTPRADLVVAFARSLNLPPVEALVAAGYITATEAGQTIEVRPSLSEYPLDDLLEELRRRTITG